MGKRLWVALLASAVGLSAYAWAGSAGESAVPADGPKKAKFDIPVWSPEARWAAEPQRLIGSGARGRFLGGKADEAVCVRHYGAGRASFTGTGPYGLTSYDPPSGRIHLVGGGSAVGLLDGPLSRARFGASDYSHRPRGATSADGRYVFLTEPYFGQVLRRIDLATQTVTTVKGDLPPVGGMTANSQGQLLVLVADSDRLLFLDTEGEMKVVKEVKVDKQEKVGSTVFPCKLTLDEAHGRLYGSGYGTKQWYIWYWDLADGSFHGVLARPQKGEKARRSPAGPFEGASLYGEMWTDFGPDDPEKNFLYATPNDTMTFYRLDLARQHIWACSREKGGVRFVSEGKANNLMGANSWRSHIDGQGNIVFTVPFWEGPRQMFFPRVK